mmetsp:Transcript_61936/g.167083  ORF Transcript_61936/g.167083 Transcript_61936/m.167083 type:complete len:237 (+) Transcript_61936:329-1039(+)
MSSYLLSCSSSSRASSSFDISRSERSTYPEDRFSSSSSTTVFSCQYLCMPSRRSSRSSRATCSCSCTSSFLQPCCFFSSMIPVSRLRSASSFSAIVLILSSRAAMRTSHFCFSAWSSRISSLCCASPLGASTRPSASRSRKRRISSSAVSVCALISNWRSWRPRRSAVSPALAADFELYLAARSFSSPRIRSTCGSPWTCCARCSRPARSASTSWRRSHLRASTSTAAFLACSSWT